MGIPLSTKGKKVEDDKETNREIENEGRKKED